MAPYSVRFLLTSQEGGRRAYSGVPKVGQNVNAMGKRVNKERVEREADAPALNPLQLKLTMVGTRFRDLLERKSLNNETLTREEFTNARDNLMLLLTIRNIKRTGDVPHLKLRLIESVTKPEGQDIVDLGLAEHKTAMSGKPSQVMVTVGELQQLKYLAHQTRARAAKLQQPEPKYVFTNVTTGKLEPSTVSKALTADWDRYFKEMYGFSKNHVKFTATALGYLGISCLRDAGITRQEQLALAKHMTQNLSTADRKYDDSEQVYGKWYCWETATENLEFLVREKPK